MELKKLTVHNYKSLVNFELNEPNAFTVFAGPNGAGKSNIFEALEFASYLHQLGVYQTEKLFYGKENFINFNVNTQAYSIVFDFYEGQAYVSYKHVVQNGDDFIPAFSVDGYFLNYYNQESFRNQIAGKNLTGDEKIYFQNFLRLFVNNEEVKRINYTSNDRLLPDASNLPSVLKRILADETIKEEFLEWLDLFIPGFENIRIHSDNIGGTDTLLIYEKGTQKPFTKNLISDGTYNILALLTAVYQTNEPQFLCIEEPENGLNPYVVESLVDFFRRQCEEKGHVIWLNTHSQTLVKHLRPEELVLVEKKNGETVIKQFPAEYNLHGFTMDEAWLTNMLGGGLPW